MEKLFEEFVKEIDTSERIPAEHPYDYSQYDDTKTKRVLRDIDVNRNHSWIKEIWQRNKNRLDTTAMIYRGQKYSYRDFFTQSYRYAKAMKANGYIKGQEFVCAIENTPEFPYIMGAASILGAKVNLVSSEFDKDYLIEILDRAESPFVFVSDMSFAKFSPALNEAKSEKKVIPISIDYSLKHGNPYKNITEQFYKLDEDTYNKAITETKNIVNIDEFLASGEHYNGKVVEKGKLDDEFTTTYTSGSTGWGRPKGLVHRVRSYITMGRYHDAEISGIPSMRGRRVLTIIKTMSDTDFMSNISDTFMQGGNVALEPINEKEFFLTSIIINKPNCTIASRCYWLYAMKQQKKEMIFKNLKFPFLIAPTAVGEPLPASEEKALNKWLKKTNAGIDITKIPVVCMCTAGGDSEHGGIFFTLFRNLQSKKISHMGINEPIGLGVYKMVQIKALRKDGTYCNPMELGQLVANSPCNMEGYVNNPDANNNFFIKDAYGKEWGNLGTYGYLDKDGNAYVKGRIDNINTPIYNFQIADEILKDTKNILSCEVITVLHNDKICYIAHIEPQLDIKFNKEKTLLGVKNRLLKKFGSSLLENLYFRIRSNEESFPLLHTGKRNIISLKSEGISENCVSACDFNLNDSSNNSYIKKLFFKKNA